VKNVNGDSTVLKYNEPPEARKPVLGWRLYVFKDSEQVGELLCRDTSDTWVDFFWFAHKLELLHIHRQSAYLIGRDRLVADIAVDHPSCSKQHAAIQCMEILVFHGIRAQLSVI
jgi:smad nuclear-interacting protein 1